MKAYLKVLLVFLLVVGVAAATAPTYRHPGFVLWGTDIDANENNITNVQNFSAMKTNGIINADEYSTIQDAINASSVGDTILLPMKNYTVDIPLNGLTYRKLQGSQFVFQGNEYGTRIKANTSASTILDMSDCYGSTVIDLILDGGSVTSTCINLNRSSSGSHQNRFERLDLYNATTALVNSSNSEDNTWVDVLFSTGNSDYGLYVDDIGGIVSIYDGIFTGDSKAQLSFMVATGHNGVLNVYGTVFTDNTTTAQINLSGNAYVNLYDVWMERCYHSPNILGDSNDAVNSLNLFGGLLANYNTTDGNIAGSFDTLNTVGADLNAHNAPASISATTTYYHDYGSYLVQGFNKNGQYTLINRDEFTTSHQEVQILKQRARLNITDGTYSAYLTMDGDNTQWTRNAYHNGTGWVRTNDTVSAAMWSTEASGSTKYFSAAAGSGVISWTTRFTLGADGISDMVAVNLPTAKPSTIVAGTMFYNTTSKSPNYYDGAAWRYANRSIVT